MIRYPRILRVYVAGPYSSGDTADNVHIAIDACDRVEQAGLIPYCPHLTHFLHLVELRPYQDWLAHDRVWLGVCDAVLRLPGKSSGADLEVALAKKLGIPTFTDFEEMRAAAVNGFPKQTPVFAEGVPDALDWPRVYIAAPGNNGDIVVDIRNGIGLWHRLSDAGFSGYLPLMTHFLDQFNDRPKNERDAYNRKWFDTCQAVITMPGNDPTIRDILGLANERGMPIASNIPDLAHMLGRENVLVVPNQPPVLPVSLDMRDLRRQRGLLIEAVKTIANAKREEFAGLVAEATLRRIELLGVKEDAESSVHRLTLISTLQRIGRGETIDALRSAARKGLRNAKAVTATPTSDQPLELLGKKEDVKLVEPADSNSLDDHS